MPTVLGILSREDKYHLSLKILMAKLEQYTTENVRYHQTYQSLHLEDTCLNLCTMEEENFWILEAIYVPVLQEKLYPSFGFKFHLYDTLLDTMTFVYSFKQLEAYFFLTVWNKTLPPGQTTYYSKPRKIFNFQSAKSFGIL